MTRLMISTGLACLTAATCTAVGINPITTILTTVGVGLITGAAKPKDKP